MLLTLISYTEVLLEMGVKKKWGQQARWKLVAAIEVTKVLCRFALLEIAGKRTILHPTHPERDVDPATLNIPPPEDHSPSCTTWTGARTGIKHAYLPATIQLQPKKKTVTTNGFIKENDVGKTIRMLEDSKANGKTNGIVGGDGYTYVKAQYADVSEFLLSKVLTPDFLKKPHELVRVLTGAARYAEYIWILRPLIYVAAIRKYGLASYRPYVLSLVLDLLARQLRTYHFSSPCDRSQTTYTQLEKDETSRRTWLLLYYILRGPFYQQYTKPRLDAFCANTERKFLIGFFANLLRDYQPLWEGVYFYTAGSS